MSDTFSRAVADHVQYVLKRCQTRFQIGLGTARKPALKKVSDTIKIGLENVSDTFLCQQITKGVVLRLVKK